MAPTPFCPRRRQGQGDYWRQQTGASPFYAAILVNPFFHRQTEIVLIHRLRDKGPLSEDIVQLFEHAWDSVRTKVGHYATI